MGAFKYYIISHGGGGKGGLPNDNYWLRGGLALANDYVIKKENCHGENICISMKMEGGGGVRGMIT